MSWRDKSNPRRLTTGLFWGLYGLVFLLGDWTYQLVGDKRTVNIAVGGVVVVLALIAGLAACASAATISVPRKRNRQRETPRQQTFFPALAIPVVTVIGVLLFNNRPHGRWRSSGRATTRR
ncbi:5-oxoproline transporter, DUF979 family subunit [Klebsiella quasipneumoniae subsp. similipneumoniae]